MPGDVLALEYASKSTRNEVEKLVTKVGDATLLENGRQLNIVAPQLTLM